MLIASAALLMLMIMTFTDVLLRSTINAPIEAATELTRILVAITVFAALPVVSGRGEHIAVDLLDPLFKRWASRLRDGLLSILCGVLLYWPCQRVIALSERARDYGDVTEYLHIPQYLVAYGIALSVGATSLVLICRGIVLLFDKQQRDNASEPVSTCSEPTTKRQ